jgi:hypothetical protein
MNRIRLRRTGSEPISSEVILSAEPILFILT